MKEEKGNKGLCCLALRAAALPRLVSFTGTEHVVRGLRSSSFLLTCREKTTATR
ncbi:hypothetical protein Cadr_000022665 [Camelus dromedarius]|uniref:Uncharacterized protein n=1 Tax=Camelus dromedarius TaxID=9838 RepID=A0A5N4CH22_CAMDR|nr:hypothetical protein Cadr_000022665 [Camelus dromedarius]